jgi:predicted glycosyltransferase involved in capsule biosynthesis
MASVTDIPAVTIIVNCYSEIDNASFVGNLVNHYQDLPVALKEKFEVILVDDHSPHALASFVQGRLNMRILRVDDDIPWNQPGARNLGVVYSRSDKIVMHDVGQCLPQQTLEKIVEIANPSNRIYKFAGVSERDSSVKLKSHPNTLFMSRSRFLRYYGYDEEFAGHYGREDTCFTRLQRRFGARIGRLSSRYPVIFRERDEDFDYSGLKRDKTINTALMERKLALARRLDEGCFSRKFLSFSFHLAMEFRLRDSSAGNTDLSCQATPR